MKFLNKQREEHAKEFAIAINLQLGLDKYEPFVKQCFKLPEDGYISPLTGHNIGPQIYLEEYSITKVEDLLEKAAEFFDEIFDYAVKNKLPALRHEMVEYGDYCTALQNIITDEIFEQAQEAKKNGVSNEQKENAATQKPALKAF